jgi:HAMP domain-containing protein
MATMQSPMSSPSPRTALTSLRTPFWRAETIGQKLGWGFLMLLAVLAVYGAVAYTALTTVGADVASMEADSMQAMEAAHLQRLSETALVPVRDYVLTGDPDTKTRFDRLAANIDATIAQLGGGNMVMAVAPTQAGAMAGMGSTAPAVEAASPQVEIMASMNVIALTSEELELLMEVESSWLSVQAGVEQIFHNPDPVGDQAAIDQLAKLEPLAERMAAFSQSIHLGGMKNVRLSRESANATIFNTSLFLIGAVVLAILVSVLLSRLIGGAITQPMTQLTRMATDISLGELETRVEVQSKGEIGELARAVERMRTSLKMTIDRLAEGEEDLRSWSTQLVDRELRRKVRGGGITLGGQRYEVGREFDGQFVYIKFDLELREIVVTPAAGAPRRFPLRA